MTEKTYIEAVRDAHYEALRDDEDAFILGEDVEKSLFNSTTGLVDEFGEERVRNTPISEQGFTGIGIGAAMDGKRPIVEFQINTLPHIAMEQVVNHAQRIRFLSGAEYDVPITFTVPSASISGGHGGQHSDNPYPSLMHYGLKTVVPSTPSDAKGLFRSAFEENDPVALYFPVFLHDERGDVPDETYRIPLGEADIKREGDDLTIVAISEAVPMVTELADSIDDVSIEVIDPRTLLPLDERTIAESVRKTGRAIVVDPANRTCGAAAEIVSRIETLAFGDLEAPIKRVTRADTHIAWNPNEEFFVVPDEDTVRTAIRDVTA